MTPTEQIWNAINQAIKEDRKMHPNFPDHPCGKSAMVMEPASELVSLTVQEKYDHSINFKDNRDRQMDAAVKVIARAYRFIENLESWKEEF